MDIVRVPNALAVVTEDAIRERAYLIWERRGRPEATNEENWHLAEAELRQEAEARSAREAAAVARAETNPRIEGKGRAKRAAPSKRTEPAPRAASADASSRVRAEAGKKRSTEVGGEPPVKSSTKGRKSKAADHSPAAPKRSDATPDGLAVAPRVRRRASRSTTAANETSAAAAAAPATPPVPSEAASDTPLPRSARRARKEAPSAPTAKSSSSRTKLEGRSTRPGRRSRAG